MGSGGYGSLFFLLLVAFFALPWIPGSEGMALSERGVGVPAASDDDVTSNDLADAVEDLLVTRSLIPPLNPGDGSETEPSPTKPEIEDEEKSTVSDADVLMRDGTEPAAAEGGGSGEKKRKRPVLGKASFGYRHAQHLNPSYSHHDLSPLFEKRREKLTFATHRDSNLDFCPVSAEDFDCQSRENKEYRKADGSCNNLRRPFIGQSSTPYRRLLPRKHSLVGCGAVALSRLPNPRLASRLLAKRSEADVSRRLTMFVMVWGQLIDHDMMMTPVRQTEEGEFLDCCDPQNEDAEDCCPIRVPRGDFFYGQLERPDCIPFLRSKVTEYKCGGSGRGQLRGQRRPVLLPDVENMNTAWIDLSFIYGSTQEKADFLRAETGGKLLASEDKSKRVFPHISFGEGFRMEFGDTRGDVHPAFTLLSTAFLRHHNQLTDQLASLHPSWSSDQLYNEARKINSAIGQHITYTEFMDALLGRPNDVRTNDRQLHRDYYKPNGIDARISMIFSTAAYRLHTYVGGRFELRDQRYRLTSTMLLRDVFHDPLKLLANDTHDSLMRGLASQSVHQFNNLYTPEMTEWLFADKDKDFGLDIISLNVQRGRDHQIPGYTSYREFCGLGSVSSWDDLEDFISHENVHRLSHTYRRPEDVDMYVAANMEFPVRGSLVGPTMHCYIREQFKNLRDGDRFFYTRPSEFSGRQLRAIKRAGSLASLLCAIADDASAMMLPRNAFAKIDARSNRLTPCSEFPKLDISQWA